MVIGGHHVLIETVLPCNGCQAVSGFVVFPKVCFQEIPDCLLAGSQLSLLMNGKNENTKCMTFIFQSNDSTVALAAKAA